jgi:predicted 3-demethylubiquinone-9 3-methyltransferase (glyoxalase superfamily)
MQRVNNQINQFFKELIKYGLEEEIHFWGVSEDFNPEQLQNLISNIEEMNRVMLDLRPIVIKALKQIADDYKKEKIK